MHQVQPYVGMSSELLFDVITLLLKFSFASPHAIFMLLIIHSEMIYISQICSLKINQLIKYSYNDVLFKYNIMDCELLTLGLCAS